MKYSAYPYNLTARTNRYTFTGVGKRPIIKQVIFTFTGIDNLINMGFGDLQPDGSIDDKANSNNGDMIKVLATIVQVLGDFVSKFKELPPAYPFTHTLLPPGENPFPEKLKKAQEMLSKTKFLDSK